MKGLIFTEFIEMVESQFGYDVSDKIITKADLPSGGVYTAVGTYPQEEIVALVVQLHEHSKIPIPDLIEAFGEYLFGRFASQYKHFFEGKTTVLDFLDNIEDYIHVEVLKLYPDALLPTIEIINRTKSSMTMIYRSPRKMAHLAIGLIKGCARYFEVNVDMGITKSLNNGAEVWIDIKVKQ